MSEVTITIVGTGVIGTSLGLALRRLEGAPYVIGHDKEFPTAKAAAAMGAFDKVEWNLINACDKADLVVLALPLAGIEQTLAAIGPELKEDTVVTDSARLKAPVLALARRHLPAGVHFVGGDPVVTPAGSGHANARANLFEDALFCLTPEADTHQDAVALVEDMVRRIGAQPFYLDAVEHDGLVCGVEQLPLALSTALVRLASRSGSWRELRKLAGSSFMQATAGVAGDPEELRDRLLSDRENILRWLREFKGEVEALHDLIASEDAEGLGELLDQLERARADWVRDFESKRLLEAEGVPPRVEQRGFMRRLIGLGK